MIFHRFAYRNVIRNKRTYAAYFASSAFSVMVFFICSLFVYNPAIQDGLIVDSAVTAMIGAEAVMYFFSFLFVLYSVNSFLSGRSKEFAVYLMHGMSKRQLSHILFWENMMIGATAVGLGIAMGLLFGKLFLMASGAILGLSNIPFYVTWQPLLLTICSFLLLFLVISLSSRALIGRSKLIDLFQAGRSPKGGLKASVPKAALGALLLAASYYLAATTKITTVYFRFFPVAAMTIAGTYLLYAHIVGVLIERWKRNRRFYWRRTNLIAAASLTNRFKDNARMLAMVTVLSTVSFCSVGVFASVNTLMRSFQDDYPAALGYVSKQGNELEEAHLRQIEGEFRAKGIAFAKDDMPIKYMKVSASSNPRKIKTLPVIAFSDYEQAVRLAGRAFDEQLLHGDDALVILTSEREKSYIGVRKKETYRLLDQPELTIREVGYTDHVPIPDYLSASLDLKLEEQFGGVVVSDERFGKLIKPIQTDRYFGYYTADPRETVGMAADMAKDGLLRYNEGESYAITVSGILYNVQRSLYSMMLLVSLLFGSVLFIAAGSFLYFRLYADLEYDRRQYGIIAKLGMSPKQLDKAVTRQLAILFFVPIGVAVLHSLFAFVALQTLVYLSVAMELGLVLAGFVLAQVIYFFFIRNRYLRNLRKRIG
ncbi:FtsX-like permease family protein [Paenibacillus sp. NPDC058071]|uniref:FtsX-like permease family protein n=1 Tax=Paenibacillus sp. NPDC058071 TaxID=3346326 RepID=UPI0036DED186